MLIFLLGLLSLIGLIFSLSLFFWNLLHPMQNEKRIQFHCYVGLISLLPTVFHLYLSNLNGSSYESIMRFGFVLYLIVIFSGMLLFYFPHLGNIRYQARSFHPALVLGLVIILLYHVLSFFHNT